MYPVGPSHDWNTNTPQVVWDGIVPPDVTWNEHIHSLHDAIVRSVALCEQQAGGRMVYSVMLGRRVAELVQMLPVFVNKASDDDDAPEGAVFGKLGDMVVHTEPTLDPDRWVAIAAMPAADGGWSTRSIGVAGRIAE